jgi:hypothetical protein
MAGRAMNRWRQRLAELQGDTGEQPSVPQRIVQNVRNVQNPAPKRAFEHFEQIEHAREALAATSSALDRALRIPREWVEGFARLDPDRPPGDMPPRRWQSFVADVELFLDGPFCTSAAALGWQPPDLFGCDRDRPFARIDQAGLLWLLNGDRLVALSECTATVETRTGARHSWRRQSFAPGRMLPWELIQ